MADRRVNRTCPLEAPRASCSRAVPRKTKDDRTLSEHNTNAHDSAIQH